MMTPRNASARLVLGSALLSAVSLVAAQVDPASPVLVPGQRVILMQRAAEPAPGQDGNTVAAGKSDAEDLDEVPTTNSIGSFDETQREQLIKQHDQKRQQLRQQLADPAQRAQLRAERIRQLRAERPDLARVVGMDAKTEERLMELLAERAFASELAPSPFERNSSSLGFNQGAPGNSSRSPDAEYTRQMSEVAKLLGAVQLERYLDYQQSLWQRSQVEQFDAALPVKDKLNADQKDRMVALLEEQQQSSGQELQIRGWFGLRTFGDPTQSMQERDRRMAEHNILINERAAADMEIANRNLLERLTAVLTPEQSAVFAKLQQERVTTLRRWTQQERRRRGISPDQVLERPEDAVLPAPILASNLSLTIDLSVNGTAVVKTVRSVRGGTVSLEAPEGLVVEARPYLAPEDILIVELKFYEPALGGRRRLIGSMSSSPQVTNPRKPSQYGGGNNLTSVGGRKGYAINWSATATYE